MSESIHETISSVFKNKSKREIAEMCNPENPDYKVVELWKKQSLKKSIIEERKIRKLWKTMIMETVTRTYMKKQFAFLIFFISFLIFAPAKEYKIDGPKYSKQIFDEKNNQITNFKNWELIQSFYVSPDCSKMLVYHRPDKAKAFLFTLYDLSNNSVIAETEPGWACKEIQFTDDYLIWVWGTSGGGTRHVYLSYKDLSIYKVITSYHYIEDIKNNQLITWDYHGDYSSKDEVFYVFFYNYTNANETDKISQTFLAKKIHEQIADPDIAISGIHIEDFEKIGQNKYKITVSYCSLSTKTNVETSDNIKTIIYEVGNR